LVTAAAAAAAWCQAPHLGGLTAAAGDRFKTQVTRRPATVYWIVMTRLGTPFYLITTRRECRLAGDACQTTRSR